MDERLDNDAAAHARVSSWFLGPRAENFPFLSEFMLHVLNDQRKARESIYPSDPNFITEDVTETEEFMASMDGLRRNVKALSKRLAKGSVPFWSPRYNGHMLMDTTIPSIVGYMAAMMYNPNNVVPEASPVTTEYERAVGKQLCRILGYGGAKLPLDSPREPNLDSFGRKVEPWGHITCDGSVANLEAIWAIRNLKYYPLSLRLAMEEKGPLSFLADIRLKFQVKTCQGVGKLFKDLSTWELLNLRPETVLDLPTQLYKQYSLSPEFLERSLYNYLVQTVGINYLNNHFNVKHGRFFLSATKHYSWPKGGAITGLGSGCFIDVKVDNAARIDLEDLDRRLRESLENQVPVFGVVAIMGSTEHGSCDPLEGIVVLRKRYQAEGLSFAIHCDAAWGGYFASMLPEGPSALHLAAVSTPLLKEYTKRQLQAFYFADSITIDPHKSGYINYPAGALCYRDHRMRYLITWTSPIVFHEGDDQVGMGVYGVEGSKPGAAPVAAWLTHETLGLSENGYGRLLGEAMFTSTKLYCHWATLTTPEDALIVTPLIPLPEMYHYEDKTSNTSFDLSGSDEVKQFVRERIVQHGLANEQLRGDNMAFTFMCEQGGDLMINAFACNFKINGVPNRDVVEANYLNQRIFQRLSVSTTSENVAERPLFLTSSTFNEQAYGDCLRSYKRNLGLVDENGDAALGDLVFLVNVTMSPWPTINGFLDGVVADFKRVAEEEMERSIIRNKITPDKHSFIMQGFNQIYLVYMPMFNKANRRRQLIMRVEFPSKVLQHYQTLRKENPGKVYILETVNNLLLSEILVNESEVMWQIVEATPSRRAKPLFTFTRSFRFDILVNESLRSDRLMNGYPERMPFYLYGNQDESHIDHLLATAPNAQLTAEWVKLDLRPTLSNKHLRKGVIAIFEDLFERSIQPLTRPVDGSMVIQLAASGVTLTRGSRHRVSVYKSYHSFRTGGDRIAHGDVILQRELFADWMEINGDPADL